MEPLPAVVRGDASDDVVLLHGFGLEPGTYGRTLHALSVSRRAIAPQWLDGSAWHVDRTIARLVATFDHHAVEQATVVGHSFGGALALRFAALHPERVRRLVLCDSEALTQRWELARQAVPGTYLWRLATYRAATAFLRNVARRPVTLARAGWWGFRNDAGAHVERVARSDLDVHVLWAQRDTLLEREVGQRFAERLDASFHIVEPVPGGGPVDHDWVYRHPWFLPTMLDVCEADEGTDEPGPADRPA